MIFRIIIILAWQHHYLLLCWWLVISGPDTELGRRWILNRRQMARPYTLLYRIVRCSLGMKCVPEIRDRSGCSIYHIQHYSLLRQKHVCTYLSPNYSLKSAWTGQPPIGWLKQLWENNWDWDTYLVFLAKQGLMLCLFPAFGSRWLNRETARTEIVLAKNNTPCLSLKMAYNALFFQNDPIVNFSQYIK